MMRNPSFLSKGQPGLKPKKSNRPVLLVFFCKNPSKTQVDTTWQESWQFGIWGHVFVKQDRWLGNWYCWNHKSGGNAPVEVASFIPIIYGGYCRCFTYFKWLVGCLGFLVAINSSRVPNGEFLGWVNLPLRRMRIPRGSIMLEGSWIPN